MSEKTTIVEASLVIKLEDLKRAALKSCFSCRSFP